MSETGSPLRRSPRPHLDSPLKTFSGGCDQSLLLASVSVLSFSLRPLPPPPPSPPCLFVSFLSVTFCFCLALQLSSLLLTVFTFHYSSSGIPPVVFLWIDCSCVSPSPLFSADNTTGYFLLCYSSMPSRFPVPLL